ncbi:uncharacterized protein [Asterias amurensis]|uniref:uncharacterized protein isoform X2 n=1 Tax=Asterias amurensis TaxID=7602 RepID=UPI003AB77078
MYTREDPTVLSECTGSEDDSCIINLLRQCFCFPSCAMMGEWYYPRFPVSIHNDYYLDSHNNQRYFSSVASGIHRGVISMSEVALASSSPPDTIRRNSSADEDGQIGHNTAEEISRSPHHNALHFHSSQKVAAAANRSSPSSLEKSAAAAAAAAASEQQHQQHQFLLHHHLSQQQMQQLLQQQVLTPQQLQLLMQQQSFLQQQQKLQEQAQLLQQMQAATAAAESGGKNSGKLQQQQQQLHSLAMQQAHLLQTLQAQQAAAASQLLAQQAAVGQPISVAHIPQGMSQAEVQALWKEVSAATGAAEDGKATSAANSTPTSQSSSHTRSMVNGAHEAMLHQAQFMIPPHGMMLQSEESAMNPNSHPLYAHGMCKWPGCETVCDDFQAFLKHLSTEHALDDRSTAQARVQLQVVSQLEIQLAKERERLAAMMAHLHMKPMESRPESSKSYIPSKKTLLPPQTPPSVPKTMALVQPPSIIQPPSLSHLSLLKPMRHPTPNLPTHHMRMPSPPPMSQSQPPTTSTPSSIQINITPGGGPIRRRTSEKYGISLGTEIYRNADFYKMADVRPPFTYAALIRQGILESPDGQLTLNEIYNWFTRTFAYFRRNAATWKNAVRHNLSLHKCFVRVENVKGAVWTVDELEFMKRRPQKLSSCLTTPPSTPTTPTAPVSRSLDISASPLPLNLETPQASSGSGGALPLLSDAAAASSIHDQQPQSDEVFEVEEVSESMEHCMEQDEPEDLSDKQELPTRVKLASSRFNSTMEEEEIDGTDHAEPRYVTAEQEAENDYTEAELETETRYLRIQQEQNLRYLEQTEEEGIAAEEDLEDAEVEEEGVGEMERLPTMNGQVMMGGGHNHLHHLEQEQPEDLSREPRYVTSDQDSREADTVVVTNGQGLMDKSGHMTHHMTHHMGPEEEEEEEGEGDEGIEEEQVETQYSQGYHPEDEALMRRDEALMHSKMDPRFSTTQEEMSFSTSREEMDHEEVMERQEELIRNDNLDPQVMTSAKAPVYLEEPNHLKQMDNGRE